MHWGFWGVGGFLNGAVLPELLMVKIWGVRGVLSGVTADKALLGLLVMRILGFRGDPQWDGSSISPWAALGENFGVSRGFLNGATPPGLLMVKIWDVRGDPQLLQLPLGCSW